MMSRILKGSALFAAAICVFAASPALAGGFDGPWSVTIVTQAGNCDAPPMHFPCRWWADG